MWPIDHLRDVDRAADAAARARQQRVDRPFRGEVGAENPTAGTHHDRLRCQAERLNFFLKLQQIASHHRHQVGIDDGRAQPLILTELGKKVLRGAHRHSRQDLAQPRDRLAFVLGIGVGIQEADCDRCHTLRLKPRSCTVDVGEIDRPHDGSVSCDALLNFEP